MQCEATISLHYIIRLATLLRNDLCVCSCWAWTPPTTSSHLHAASRRGWHNSDQLSSSTAFRVMTCVSVHPPGGDDAISTAARPSTASTLIPGEFTTAGSREHLTMASIDSQLLVSVPDRRKFFEFPRKFTFRLMYRSMALTHRPHDGLCASPLQSGDLG